MDLEEWEVLPEDGLLQTYEDGGRKFYSRKYNAGNPNSDIDLNYFAVNSSQKSPRLGDQTGKELVSTLTVRKQVGVETVETDQKTVSKQNQFVDMKSEYLNLSDIGIYPGIEDGVVELIMGESEANKGEVMEDKTDCTKESEIKTLPIKTSLSLKTEVIWEEKSDGMMNIWKRSLSGVGAICSFGVAAATFCIIVFGNHRGHKQLHPHNQKIQFQFCSGEKGVKQVINNATILEEAFSSTRSVLSRAHITIGGY